MKRLSLFIVIALLTTGLTLIAQQGNRERGRMNVDQRLSRMQKQLNLTPDQVEKIRPILQDESRKMEDLRAKNQNASADRSSMRKEMQQIRNDARKHIEQVLTPDQVTKLRQQRGKFESRRRNNGNG